MKQFRVIEKADKTFILKEENVIEAIANFLSDAGMLEEHETEGKMTYKMNKDASITVELHFVKPTVN
jgi:uncharacterized protein YpiB (UPF0302 family)|tara:strand:+ start:907 stop:1107 length:201 start_codon:yes stop_codon:yes gene_type:complete